MRSSEIVTAVSLISTIGFAIGMISHPELGFCVGSSGFTFLVSGFIALTSKS